MKTKASVAIFQNSIPIKNDTRTPLIGQDIFEVVLRVVENKSTELIQNNDGLFVIAYSENGPFTIKMKNWLPVRIIMIHQYSSGGIQKSEMDTFLAIGKENQPPISVDDGS